MRSIAAAKSLFGFCQRMRFIPVNPAAELPLPRYENRLAERVLSEGDVHRLLSGEAQPRDRTLLNLLYFAGLRVSEACSLRWRNLHERGDGGQVTVHGKGGRTRSIALPAEMWSELIGLRESAGAEELVFPSRGGKPLDRGRVRIIVRQAAEQAGVAGAVSPHWLRHAHASHALDHGAPIHLVQSTLGHSSVATTSSYLHARPGDSSARFLSLGKFPLESSRLPLPLVPKRVMNVTGVQSAKGDSTMTTNSEEQAKTKATATVPEPKATKRASVAPQARPVAPAKGKATKKTTPAKKGASGPKGGKKAKAARAGSKTATVLSLVQRPGGATLKELMKATGWLPHSVRGFISGALGKKMGLTVTSAKGEDGERSYSVKG